MNHEKILFKRKEKFAKAKTLVEDIGFMSL